MRRINFGGVLSSFYFVLRWLAQHESSPNRST